MAHGVRLETAALKLSGSVPITFSKVPDVTEVEMQEGAAYTLRNHTEIATDHEPLAFQGAASLQVQLSNSHLANGEKQHLANSDADNENHRLISSTYNLGPHLLDLSRLETPSRLLAVALTFMKPVRPDYATAPYLDSFNWDRVMTVLRQLVAAEDVAWQRREFYVVIFRSRLNEQIDRHRLGELDQHSHAEANESGGLLKYWFGKPDADRRNLATCLWRSPEDARAGGTGPWHKLARAAASVMYETIKFSTHRLTIGDGVNDWRFEDWSLHSHAAGPKR